MVLIIIGVLIAVLVIVIKVKKKQNSQLEHKELRETIRNSGMLKELREKLQSLISVPGYNWLDKQRDYYDECERRITVFNAGIGFSILRNGEWQPMHSLDFVEDLGYSPLLDNGLQTGKKYIQNKDIYCAFADEIAKIAEEVFHNDEIKFGYSRYHDGFRSEQQPDGSFKRIRIGEETAYVDYKIPKTVGAKKI